MLVSEKYLSKLQNETKFMKIGHTMPELQPFTFHEKFVAHPVYNYNNNVHFQALQQLHRAPQCKCLYSEVFKA